MKLIYQHDAAAPITQVYLVVPRSGACLDPAALQGASRLALRLMFMGAGGLSHEALSGQLERLGAATGFSLFNDHVTLRLTTLTENLDQALELFLSALHAPNFDADEFAQLQGELTSGWIADREESKQLRAQEVYQRRLYAERPTGYRADGTLDGLRTATLADLRRQYRRLLARDDAFCAVLSDLPRDGVEARILARLALPTPQEGDAPPAWPWERFAPQQREGRHVTIVADADTSTDELLLGGFSAPLTVPDWHVHRLISYGFGGDMNSRLFRIVRGERGLSYGASCWYDAAGRAPRNQPAPFSVYTFPSVEHTAQAVPLVLELYETLVRDGLSTEELRLGRAALINSHPFQRDTPQKLLALDMEQALFGVMTDDDAENRRKLEGVTEADVRAALREWHHPERLELVLLGDPARLEPIAAALPGVDSIETIRYPEGNGAGS